MPEFPIVDAHIHLYDPEVIRYAWMAGKPALEGRHLIAELDAARGPVAIERLVFVEVGADPGQHLEEAAFVDRLAESDPRIAAIVAHAPLERGAAVAADLEKLAARPRVRGVRRLLQDETDAEFCLRPAFVEGVRLLSRFGFSFDICVRHHQLAGAVALVRRCPEVRFVLDHIGKPGIAAGLTEPWRSHIKELSELPNAFCKLSGVITEADHARWRPADLCPYIEHAIACFGFARLMFGGDWPVSEQTHRYPAWVAILDEITAGCSDAERRALFRDTATRFYRLDS